MRLPLRLAALVVAVLAAGSCKSRGGDTCSAQQEACADEHTKLVCRHDRFAAVACDGPKGCKAEGEKATCDFSGNKVGSACDDLYLGKRMCKDGKTAIGCADGKVAAFDCRGPAGCTAGDDGLVKTCDDTVAKVGDLCDRALNSKPACDVDGKGVLECGKDNKYAFARHCRGPNGCKSEKGAAVCDQSIQQVGDPCVPPTTEICSADGVAVLLCDGQRIFEKMCPGPKGCSIPQGGGISCDAAVPYEGMACEKKGQQACSKALGKEPEALLECDGSKFKISKKCAKGCQFTRPSTYACK